MAGQRSDPYVIEAIASLFHASGDAVGDAPALERFREELSAAAGRELPVDMLRHLALDGLRQLTAAARPDDKRKFTIAARCDVRGESHKAVAVDLSLSRSQFYRDLRSARREVGRHVERVARRRTFARPLGAFDMNVATIPALHSCGRASDAIDASRELAQRECGANAIVARCLTVELLASECRVEEAERERTKLPKDPDAAEGRFAPASAMRLVADATIALSRLDSDVELRARVALEATARLDERDGRADAEALATSLLARAFMENGKLAAGHALLATYDRSPSATRIRPSLRAALISVRSDLYQFEPWALGESYEHTRQLLECAVVNELPRPGIDALAAFGALLCKQDRLVEAEPFVNASLANARRAGNAEQVAAALGTMSLLFSESGRAELGLEAAERLSATVGDAGVWAVQGALLRSLALLRLRRTDEALQACRHLEAETMRRRDASALGVTKRIMAEAYHARGNRRKALAHIDESVSLLEEVGRPYMLSRSYDVSHRFTGNQRHASLARSLRSALQEFDARAFLPDGAVTS